jgi:hypothetical protein
MQVARRLWPDDEFHGTLRDLTDVALKANTAPRKRDVYGRIANVLTRNMDTLELGIWDYWNEPDKVTSGFQDWVDGLDGKEARHTPAPQGEDLWQVFTLAFLMKKGSNTDERLAAACQSSEEKLWRRKTFARILEQGVTGMNFATVKSEVIYLLPRSPAYGLTDADLKRSGNFDYLRPLTD